MRTPFLLFLSLLTLVTFAQNSSKKKNIKDIDSLSIDQQLEYIVNNSDSYTDYKVISKKWLSVMKSHLRDSLAAHTKQFRRTKAKLSEISIQKDSLANTISDLQGKLNKLDNVDLMLFTVSKKNYHTVLWSIIGVLVLILIYTRYQFSNAHRVTKDTLKKFDELEQEFNQSRTRALEREQVLNRKIIDLQKDAGL